MVFRAYDNASNRNVAIKRSDKNTEDHDYDQGMPLAPLREAAMLRTLRHANVVTLHEIIITDSAIYLVLELCFCNLRQHLHELQEIGLQTMEPRSLCCTASQIFSALSYIHELRIIHR
jgi:cyclin-dependent kinase 14